MEEFHAPHIGLVVEGQGDAKAVPVLLRKWLHEQGEFRSLLGKPVSCNGKSNATRALGVEGRVAAAASRPGCRAVLVILDADEDDVQILEASLTQRVKFAAGVPVRVHLAVIQFEDWVVASGETMDPPIEYLPDEHAVELVKRAMGEAKYVKPTHQPRFAARVDFSIARPRSASLDAMLTSFQTLIGECESVAIV